MAKHKGAEHHSKAAEHHEHAARREAAKHDENGSHERVRITPTPQMVTPHTLAITPTKLASITPTNMVATSRSSDIVDYVGSRISRADYVLND